MRRQKSALILLPGSGSVLKPIPNTARKAKGSKTNAENNFCKADKKQSYVLTCCRKRLQRTLQLTDSSYEGTRSLPRRPAHRWVNNSKRRTAHEQNTSSSICADRNSTSACATSHLEQRMHGLASRIAHERPCTRTAHPGLRTSNSASVVPCTSHLKQRKRSAQPRPRTALANCAARPRTAHAQESTWNSACERYHIEQHMNKKTLGTAHVRSLQQTSRRYEVMYMIYIHGQKSYIGMLLDVVFTVPRYR